MTDAFLTIRVHLRSPFKTAAVGELLREIDRWCGLTDQRYELDLRLEMRLPDHSFQITVIDNRSVLMRFCSNRGLLDGLLHIMNAVRGDRPIVEGVFLLPFRERLLSVPLAEANPALWFRAALLLGFTAVALPGETAAEDRFGLAAVRLIRLTHEDGHCPLTHPPEVETDLPLLLCMRKLFDTPAGADCSFCRSLSGVERLERVLDLLDNICRGQTASVYGRLPDRIERVPVSAFMPTQAHLLKRARFANYRLIFRHPLSENRFPEHSHQLRNIDYTLALPAGPPDRLGYGLLPFNTPANVLADIRVAAKEGIQRTAVELSPREGRQLFSEERGLFTHLGLYLIGHRLQTPEQTTALMAREWAAIRLRGRDTDRFYRMWEKCAVAVQQIIEIPHMQGHHSSLIGPDGLPLGGPDDQPERVVSMLRDTPSRGALSRKAENGLHIIRRALREYRRREPLPAGQPITRALGHALLFLELYTAQLAMLTTDNQEEAARLRRRRDRAAARYGRTFGWIPCIHLPPREGTRST
jgi:hypothetical protein